MSDSRSVPEAAPPADREPRRSRLPSVIAIVSVLLAALALGYAARELGRVVDSRRDDRVAAEEEAHASTQSSAMALDRLLGEIARSVDELAGRMSAGEIDDGLVTRLAGGEATGAGPGGTTCSGPGATELERALCEAAAATPAINGIGALFDPKFDPKSLYRPYANRIDGPLRLGELSSRVPSDTDWYVSAAAGRASWTHPRFGQTSQTLLATYSAPFYAQDGSLRGVMIATYTLDRLADDLRLLSVGKTGYSIVLSDRGKLVSHPQVRRVHADFSDDPPPQTGMVAALADAVRTDPDDHGMVVGLYDEVTDSPAWLVYEPMPTVGWTYGAVVSEREVLHRTTEQTRRIIQVVLVTALGLLLLSVVAFGAYRGSHHGLWTVSIMAGALALVAIGVVWYLTNTGPGDSAATAERSALAPVAETHGEEPVFAGVFVQSLEFTGANDVTVSGIVWQEQRSDTEGAGPPGFVFPEADEVEFVEQYRTTRGNLTRVGWSFTASLRETFDYTRYPLDRETVWLRLWRADYGTEIPLLPDLSSYVTLAPHTQPGIERDFVVEGWELEASSFSFRDNPYNTTFGISDRAGTKVTELYFNVHLKRSFLDAMMSQLVPLTVVALLLFGVLLITTMHRPGSEESSFPTLEVLAYCAALFFVVIVSQADLRSKLQAQHVIYLDYFYFASYAAILLVSANALLVGSGRGGRFITYGNNVVPALLFWPVLNGALLVVTLLTFY